MLTIGIIYLIYSAVVGVLFGIGIYRRSIVARVPIAIAGGIFAAFAWPVLFIVVLLEEVVGWKYPRIG